MKLIVIILLILSQLPLQARDYSTHELLITGFSYHPEPSPTSLDYNEFNYGLGYRYRVKKDNQETYISTTAFNDSYNHLMCTLTVGAGLYLYENDLFDVRVGVDMGLGVRKLLYVYEDERQFKYGVIPVLAPFIATNYKNVGFTISYVPNVTFDDVEINEVMYGYFSIGF